MQKELVRISKYLSFLLRHEPSAIGLELDDHGWAFIDELIQKTSDYQLTRELVEILVETNDKQRFCISADGRKIRANQGHSIEVDLNLAPCLPPVLLFHGTADRFLDSIERAGLLKQQRHHVHLTESTAVAKAVGGRYGKPVILTLQSGKMSEDGYVFYKTLNNVWLVDHVPVKYITRDLPVK